MNINEVQFLKSYGLSSQLPSSENVEIVFAGRSNVGKSSLINKVFNRKNLARVSAVPGKTATINFYGFENEGTLFVDLPGYGYAKVAKSEKHRWSDLIEGYFHQDRKIALVVLLVDIRHAPSDLDVSMVEFLVEQGLPFIVVLTKADKLSNKQKEERLSMFRSELPFGGELHLYAVSAQTGEGIETLRTIFDEFV